MDKQKFIVFFVFFFTFFVQLFSSQTPPARRRANTTSSPLGTRKRADSDPLAAWRAKHDARLALLEKETQRRLDAIEELAFGGTPSNTRPDSEGGDNVPQWPNLSAVFRGARRQSVVEAPVMVAVTYYRRKNGGDWRPLSKGAHKSPDRYEFETRQEMAFDRQYRPKGSSDPWQPCDDDHNEPNCEYHIIPRTRQVSHTDETLPSLMDVLRQNHEERLELRARLASLEAEQRRMQQELEAKEVLPERPEPKYTGQRSPRRPMRQSSVRGSARELWSRVLPSVHNTGFGIAGQKARQHPRSASPTKFPAIVRALKT